MLPGQLRAVYLCTIYSRLHKTAQWGRQGGEHVRGVHIKEMEAKAARAGPGRGGGGQKKRRDSLGGVGPLPVPSLPSSPPPPPPFFFRAIQFIYGRQSISESGSSVLCVLLGLSLVLIVRHVLHVVSHMASWAGGPLTKPKLCPAFKTSIVVCERKTN